MAVSRQPETITSETSNREGLHEDHPPRGEARWKRFHPFKVVRKIFCRRVKRQGTEEVQENSKKSWSTSELQYIPDEENRYQDHTPPYKVGLSVSHDSIFSHDHSTIMDSDELQEMQTSSLSIHETEIREFQDELFTIVRARRDSDDDDVGLPHSPCASPTTADILAQGLKKSTKSLNTCSAGSLASMESSENDEDSAGQLSSGHSSRASLLDRSAGTDSDIDSSQPIPLNHKAALHRIAVRPKRTHALPHRRRLKQMPTPTTNSLPVTPEVSEEGKHIPLSSVKSQRKVECVTKINDETQATQYKDKLSQFRIKVASTPQTNNMKQQNRKTFSSSAETKPIDVGVNLIRSRSAAAELRSYQESRQKNSQSLEKREDKQTRDAKYNAYQNKGVTVTVNKTETIFSPDGSVTTVQQRTTESGHSVLKETQLECYEDSEEIKIPNINEKRRNIAEFSKFDHGSRKEESEPTQQAKCFSISASIKDVTGGVANKNINVRSEHSINDTYIEADGKQYETNSIPHKDIPFICSNVKTVLSTLENLTDDNKQVLCNSAEMQNPQSIAVVTVTQSETSHLIREATIGENVKLSVMGAYGKTVIHTGGDIWSVSNVNNRDVNDELKPKDSNLEKSEIAHSNEEHISDEKYEINRETSPKTISKSLYDSPLEYFVVDNQKTTTPQKRFSVEIVPFNQRIKDPNYLYSSNKIENKFKTTEKILNDPSEELPIKAESRYVDKRDVKLKDHHIYKYQESSGSAENKKPIYPVHIKIHKGQNKEEKCGISLHQSETLSSLGIKDGAKKETTQICKEVSPEFMKIQLNPLKNKDEKLITADTVSCSLDNKVHSTKQKQTVDNNFSETTGQTLSLNNAKESTKCFQVSSNILPIVSSIKHTEKESIISEDNAVEVNVKESTQIWEKIAAGENVLDAKNKPVSRSSSTTSEEEPELLRVFARRSIKQKTDDKEAVTKECESTAENRLSGGNIVEDLSDSAGSNIISMSNNSTIIKISETVGTRLVMDNKITTTKLQYSNVQSAETEALLPSVPKSHKSDAEVKCIGLKTVALENANSSDSVLSAESKAIATEYIYSTEKEQKLPEDKNISVKRVSSIESQRPITDTKQSCRNTTSVCASKSVSGAKAEILTRTDSSESKQSQIQKLPTQTGTKLPINVNPIVHNISVDAKVMTDVDAKIGSVPSSGQERGIEVIVTKPPMAKNVLTYDSVQKVNKPALTEKPKLFDKDIVSVQSPTKQHVLASIEASAPSRWHGNKLRSHTVSEVSQADIQRAHLRQRKASAPDISSCRNTEISTKEISSYCTPPVHGNKPELPPKSPSVTALAATRNSALSLSVDSAKLHDVSHESTKNKEANLPSWLQLAQQRREQREQRERLLMGPAAASFVLETSGKPTRSSKVWDMVHNFQKLQMT